ncbi:TPA: hypothetical protein ACKE6T_003435, partial [Klebsiella oxytoca]
GGAVKPRLAGLRGQRGRVVRTGARHRQREKHLVSPWKTRLPERKHCCDYSHSLIKRVAQAARFF